MADQEVTGVVAPAVEQAAKGAAMREQVMATLGLEQQGSEKPGSSPAVGGDDTGAGTPQADAERIFVEGYGNLTMEEIRASMALRSNADRQTAEAARIKKESEEKLQQYSQGHELAKPLLERMADPRVSSLVSALIEGDVDAVKGFASSNDEIEAVVQQLEEADEPGAKVIRNMLDQTKNQSQTMNQLKAALAKHEERSIPLIKRDIEYQLRDAEQLFKDRGIASAFNAEKLREAVLELGVDEYTEDVVIKTASHIFANDILEAAKSQGARDRDDELAKRRDGSSPRSSGAGGAGGVPDGKLTFAEKVMGVLSGS